MADAPRNLQKLKQGNGFSGLGEGGYRIYPEGVGFAGACSKELLPASLKTFQL